MLRAVVDTNVLVSGTISAEGFPARVVNALLDRKFLLVTSEYLLSEYQAVMQRPRIANKYRGIAERLNDILVFLRAEGIAVDPTALPPGTVRDTKDSPVLACAVDGKAEYLVSGDSDLQSLGTFQGVQVVSPRQFVEEVMK